MTAPRSVGAPARVRSRIRGALTSLGLTLACLSALMVLVVVCTLAQVDRDAWEAVAITMRRWFVRWEIPGTSLSI
ncbi:MAG TPA: hypothetical protein VFI16_01905, partial [Anaeromyxobacteraceae bacterium]|nr:hypothetical protein [Anaeromyxobacteraceae bacterium]